MENETNIDKDVEWHRLRRPADHVLPKITPSPGRVVETGDTHTHRLRGSRAIHGGRYDFVSAPMIYVRQTKCS